MTPEEYRRLQTIAKSEDRSVAYVIARTVREWLENYKDWNGKKQ